MMQATATITNPDEAVVQITITASVKELRALRDLQPEHWPASDFRWLLRQVIEATVGRVESTHEVGS